MKFRKKPVVIEAEQLISWNVQGVAEWCGGRVIQYESTCDDKAIIEIPTLEGTMRAHSGDWIIRGIHGEFYPCKDDIFRKTYEPE